MNSFVVGDPSLCIGCKACLIACAENHINVEDVLSGKHVAFHPRLQLVAVPEVTVPVQCRHCEDSPCARACPENAIVQKSHYIDIIEELCVGCKTCVLACPFGAITISSQEGQSAGLQISLSHHEQQNKTRYHVEKCDLCGGDDPACVAICPADALQLVRPETLQLEKYKRRERSALNL